LAPPSRVVSEEEGWWEGGEDSPEEEVEDSPEEGVEVGVGAVDLVIYLFIFLFIFMLIWIENRVSLLDSIFFQECCFLPLASLWYLLGGRF